VGEDAVDQHCQVAGHGLDGRRVGGQSLAQVPIASSQVTGVSPRSERPIA
jgi:hypothetical protein